MKNLRSQSNREILLFRLGVVTRHWRQLLDQTIETTGLTEATWRPLFHLYLLGDGTRQKDLAQSLGLKGPSIVRLLEALLAKGLIRREEDPDDRRAKQLYLTDAGRTLVREIHTIISDQEGALLSPFNDDEISHIMSFIDRLEQAVAIRDEAVSG
nr:MarR family transcriptional regulator [uncultured Desulfuromonas sp.]